MSPREEDEYNFVEDVRGCYVEVMFQCADGDVAF